MSKSVKVEGKGVDAIEHSGYVLIQENELKRLYKKIQEYEKKIQEYEQTMRTLLVKDKST